MVYYQIILVRASVCLETNFYPDSTCLAACLPAGRVGREDRSIKAEWMNAAIYQWSGCRLTRGGGAFATGMPVGLHNQKGGTFCLQS